jgi:prepilin-type N-terminal cleavage/methylation domain-containing protein
MMTRTNPERGMSLIEVLVATAVLALAIVIALVVYDASRQSFKKGENATEQQEAVRIAFDKVSSDVRTLGLNFNPDGDATRPDEQLEAALDHAIILRADFDKDDPAANTTPETALAGGAFNVVSTGNDEIVGYVLSKPDGTGPDTITFKADVGDSPRDGAVETVTVNNVVLNPTAPPYTLYRISLNNNTALCCGGNFIVRTPVVENVSNVTFTYTGATATFKDASANISEAAADKAARDALTRVNVQLIGMTRDPDMNYKDPTEASTAPDYHYRKFTLEGDVTPRNLRMKGIQDLNSDVVPPTKPATPSLVAGHCGGFLVSWAANPSADGVTQYRVNYGTTSGAPDGSHATSGSPFFLDGLTTGTLYYISIQAQDAAGNLSVVSNQVSATVSNLNTPSAPTGLTVTNNQAYAVRASWTPVTTNTANTPAGDPAAPLIRDLAGYRLYRGNTNAVTATAGFLLVDETKVHAPAEPPHVDSPVIACHTYYYTVTAVDTCGVQSAAAAVASGQTADPGVNPSAPTNVQAFFLGAGQAQVTWNAVTTDVNSNAIAIDQYDVYRSDPIQKNADPLTASWGTTPVGSPFATTFIDNGVPALKSNELVYYRVVAHDSCINYSDPSSPAAAQCSFSGTVSITSPNDNDVVAGVVPVTVVVTGGTDTYTGVTITYVHSVAGLTRTYTSAVAGTSWTDTGWLSTPPGNYIITATVTNAAGCTSTALVHLQVGSVVGCCLDLFPTSATAAVCAGAPAGCKEVTYKIGNSRCLTKVSVTAMTIGWTDYSGNKPRWQTAKFDGTAIAAVGAWVAPTPTGNPEVGTASKNDFSSPGPIVPYLNPTTTTNATNVTYVFTQSTKKNVNFTDAFTQTYTFTLLDSLDQPSNITTSCTFRTLTAQ